MPAILIRMLDVLTRALLHPAAYAGVLRRQTLTLKEHREEGDNIHTFIFTLPKNISWRAGQHAIFTLPGVEVRGKTWRPFSVASSAREGVVQISTVIPPEPSDFKRHLLRLNRDSIIHMYGPYGEFQASGTKQHIVGVAGGIGITPFRALAYEISRRHLPETRMTLIYSARSVYAYKEELDRWQSDRLRIVYTHTPEETQTALKNQFDVLGNTASYYLSGSPGMIAALRTYCESLGVTKITNDPFKGY